MTTTTIAAVTQADVDALIDAIVADYARWVNAVPSASFPPEVVKSRARQIELFREGLTCDLDKAKKYARVISGASAWGFITMTDADPRFPVGSILKTANWFKPALNKPRGNVITRDHSWVQWTGPAYLR